MPPKQPHTFRLPDEQLAWLDSQCVGPVVSRSEALRHAVQVAMELDRQRAEAEQPAPAITPLTAAE
jgi:Arc/MetJ-type ribon-helix-helix transcriptional regulator